MSDPATNEGNAVSLVKQIFSPPMMAFLRNFLGALGLLLGMIGLGTLSPQKVEQIMAFATQLGTVIAALVAMIGALSPIAAGIWAAWTATQRQQVKSVQNIATGPASDVSIDAQQALISATGAVAKDRSIPKSEDAKQTLIAATIALDDVQTIVANKETADAAPSPSVVAAEDIELVPKK